MSYFLTSVIYSNHRGFALTTEKRLTMPVKYQICEQASNTLHHINRAKIFTENSVMKEIKGWGPTDPHNILKRGSQN